MRGLLRWLAVVDGSSCGEEFTLRGDGYLCELPEGHPQSHWNGRIEAAWGFQ